MPPVGFEPTIPVSARQQTYALDRGATGIGELLELALFKSVMTTDNLNFLDRFPKIVHKYADPSGRAV